MDYGSNMMETEEQKGFDKNIAAPFRICGSGLDSHTARRIDISLGIREHFGSLPWQLLAFKNQTKSARDAS